MCEAERGCGRIWRGMRDHGVCRVERAASVMIDGLVVGCERMLY